MIAENKEKKSLIWELKKLLKSKWWDILKKELLENIKTIEEDILNVDDKANEKKFTKHDLKRFERMNILWLIKKPEVLISYFEGSFANEQIEDVFW